MGVRLLLDTNACSALKRGDERVADLVRGSKEIVFSAVVAGELLYGFRQGARVERNLAELKEFPASPYVTFLPVSLITADRYALVASALRRKGKPIPVNDIWIAAQALECGADLVSADRYFEHVDGLAWIRTS